MDSRAQNKIRSRQNWLFQYVNLGFALTLDLGSILFGDRGFDAVWTVKIQNNTIYYVKLRCDRSCVKRQF